MKKFGVKRLIEIYGIEEIEERVEKKRRDGYGMDEKSLREKR